LLEDLVSRSLDTSKGLLMVVKARIVVAGALLVLDVLSETLTVQSVVGQPIVSA
jgi:hypothetical protein